MIYNSLFSYEATLTMNLINYQIKSSNIIYLYSYKHKLHFYKTEKMSACMCI